MVARTHCQNTPSWDPELGCGCSAIPCLLHSRRLLDCATCERGASSLVFSKNDRTKSGCPIDHPNTRTPCATERRRVSSPVHTSAFFLHHSLRPVPTVMHMNVGPAPESLCGLRRRLQHMQIIKRFSFDEALVNCPQCIVLLLNDKKRHNFAPTFPLHEVMNECLPCRPTSDAKSSLQQLYKPIHPVWSPTMML